MLTESLLDDIRLNSKLDLLFHVFSFDGEPTIDDKEEMTLSLKSLMNTVMLLTGHKALEEHVLLSSWRMKYGSE